MAENATTASKQLTETALSSIENIKFLAVMLSHSIPRKPSGKMLSWLANQLLRDAENIESETYRFKA